MTTVARKLQAKQSAAKAKQEGPRRARKRNSLEPITLPTGTIIKKMYPNENYMLPGTPLKVLRVEEEGSTP